MFLDNGFRNPQSQSIAGLGFIALKRLKKPCLNGWRDAASIVSDGQASHPPNCSQPDAQHSAYRERFRRVAHEIRNQLYEITRKY